MAYKFQLGAAIMSGALAQEGSLEIKSDINESSLYKIERTAGNVSGSGKLYHAGAATFSSTLSVTGTLSGAAVQGTAGTLTSLALQAGGITAAGSIAGATSVDGTGDLTMGTITMTGFSVDADGDTALKSLAVDNSSTIGCDADTDIMTLAAQSLIVANDVDFNVAKAGGLKYAGTAITSTAAELNKLDGAGADVTAAKLTTLSALSDTEIGYVDGAGTTVVASKAVVADANKDVGTLRNLTINGTFSDGNYTFDTSGNVTGLGTVACGAITTTGVLSSSAAATIVGNTVMVGAMNVSGATTMAGTLTANSTITLAGAADTALAVASDSIYFRDSDGSMKRDSVVDIAAAMAGVGLSAASGQFLLDLNELGSAAIAAGDSIAFIDSNDSDATKKETVDDLATLFAGVGLSAASAVLALDLNELSAAAVDVAADSIAIIDANDSNASRKESIADLATAMAGAGITATNGVFSTDAAVSSTGHGDENATLVEGLNYGTATLSADRTWTLPAAPSTNDIVRVKAPASMAGFDLIISKGSGAHRIDGEETILLESNGGAVTMQFVGNNTWLIF